MQKSTVLRPHFHFNPKDEKSSEFATFLGAELGNFVLDDCNAIIDIGGDGTVLHSFHTLSDVPNFALRTPGSKSALFNGHHNINNATDLTTAFNVASLYKLHPLRADIDMSDGSVVTVHAYQDIVAKSFNAQAVLSQKSINGETTERIMGGGWVISTPLGSTALNETVGGKVIDVGSGRIVVTTNGISDKAERDRLRAQDRVSMVVDESSKFVAELSTKAERRESTIDYDSWTIMPDGQLYVPRQPITIDTSIRSIQRLTVTMDHTQQRQLLINPQYRTPNPYFK